MSGNYRYGKRSKRATRRNRRKTPYKPVNRGKPGRSRGAGT